MGKNGGTSKERRFLSKVKGNNKHLVRQYDPEAHGQDDFNRLNRALKKIGLYCKEMDGDGNCLFRALSDQVDGTPDTHFRHREAVCDYMAAHPDEFAPFIDETHTFDQYIYNMRRPGVFAGNLELVAFARNYRVDIKVYQLGGSLFVISGAPASNPSDSKRNIPPVHIAYHSYEHYSSVRNKHGPHSGMPNIKASINSGDSVVATGSGDDVVSKKDRKIFHTPIVTAPLSSPPPTSLNSGPNYQPRHGVSDPLNTRIGTALDDELAPKQMAPPSSHGNALEVQSLGARGSSARSTRSHCIIS